MASTLTAPLSDPIQLGRYEVLARDLHLNGVGDPPRFIWVVKGLGGSYFIESSEVDGYWIKEEELANAVLKGWVRRYE